MDMTALPLERLEGKYEIVAKIKEGGMGAIYKVRHRLLDEVRVVKVMRSGLEDDSELNQRFAHEARAAIRLRHPNVIQIFDFLLEEGTGFIVMEYIRGIDFQELIHSHPPPSVALALELARQSLRALAYLHQQGFVHRDISPDNLMLCRDFDDRPLVKMIDLGIAKNRQSDQHLTASGMFLGKFRYSSPEHFGPHPGGLDARSDLYSFGVVLYELLTGRYPIRGDTNPQLIAGHLFRPPIEFAESDPEDRLPPELRETVLRAMAKEADQRYESGEAMAAALDQVQQSYPLSPAAIAEAYRLTESGGENGDAPKPGSTQSRLDRGFRMRTTPRPEPFTPASPGDAPAKSEHEEQIEALLSGAETLIRFGQTEQARGQLTAILRLVPEHQRALDLWCDLQQRLAAAGEDPSPTLDQNDRPAAGEPADRTVDRLVEEGCEREEAGDYAGAVETFEKARRLRPDNEALRQLLLEARESLHQEREAAERRLEAEIAARRRQIEEDLDRVDRLMVAKDFAEVSRCLDRLDEMEISEPDLVERIAGVDTALETIHEQITAAVDDVTRMIDEGRVVEADRALFQAEEAFGSRKSFAPLRQRLQELHRQGRAAQVRALLADADACVEDGRFDAAFAILEKLRHLADAEITGEIETRETAWRGTLARRERLQALGELEERVRRLLDEGDYGQVRRRIAGGAAAFEGLAEFDQLRERVQEDLQGRVNALLQETRSAFEARRFDAALAAIRAALEIDPGDKWLRDRLIQVETALDEQHEIESAVRSLESLIVGGELETAAERLREAIARWGEHKDLDSLQRQLEARRKTQLSRRIRSLLRQAEKAYDRRDFLRARQLTAQALELAPDDPDARDLAARLDDEVAHPETF